MFYCSAGSQLLDAKYNHVCITSIIYVACDVVISAENKAGNFSLLYFFVCYGKERSNFMGTITK